MNKSSHYKKAGVNIDAGEELVENIKTFVKKTHRPEVISDLGGYAGFFSLKSSKVKNPVLVSTTDGVGTKLKLALDTGILHHIGQDLVAMCVNDLICCGAEPLFFLDYYATGKLNVKEATVVIQSIATALASIRCSLLGGETAEMPGIYQKKDFDLAGFAVGIVDRKKIINGNQVKEGQSIIGISSSGFHSNGYSLVRQIIKDQKLNLKKSYFKNGVKLGEQLLAPTKLYVNEVLAVAAKFKVTALAHITGGGILENLPRVIPAKYLAVLQKDQIPVPELFRFFQQKGSVPEQEMWRVFNMGIGMVMVVAAKQTQDVLKYLNKTSTQAFEIGRIVKNAQQKENNVEIV